MLLIGDVLHDRHRADDVPGPVSQSGGGQPHVDDRAVLASSPHLGTGDRLPGERALSKGAMRVLLTLGERRVRAAGDLVRRPSEHALGRRVPDEHEAVGIEPDDGKRRSVDERPERGSGRVGGKAHLFLHRHCAPSAFAQSRCENYRPIRRPDSGTSGSPIRGARVQRVGRSFGALTLPRRPASTSTTRTSSSRSARWSASSPAAICRSSTGRAFRR